MKEKIVRLVVLGFMLITGILIVSSCGTKNEADEANEMGADSSVFRNSTTESSTAEASINVTNTQLAFGEAGLNLEKRADLIATCAKPDSVTSILEQLAVENRGYVLGSMITKINSEHAEAPTSGGDSLLSIDRYSLVAKITLTVPNSAFETVLAQLGTLPVRIQSRTITQKDLNQGLEESKLQKEIAEQETQEATDAMDRSTKASEQRGIRNERSTSKKAALGAQLEHLGLDNRIKWSVITVELLGPQEVLQTKIINLQSLINIQADKLDDPNISAIAGFIAGLTTGLLAGIFSAKRKK